MNSTRNHSIATNWRKNSMVGASIDTSRMALAWVVVLQILGVDGLMLTTLRWSRRIERDPPILFVSKIFWLRHVMGEILVRKLVHFWYRPLHLDHVRAGMHEIRNRSESDRGSLDNPSRCISFSNYGLDDLLSFVEISDISGHEVVPSKYVVWNWDKVILDDASVGFTFFQEMPAGAV